MAYYMFNLVGECLCFLSRQFFQDIVHACKTFGDCLTCSNFKQLDFIFCSIVCCILHLSSHLRERTPYFRGVSNIPHHIQYFFLLFNGLCTHFPCQKQARH